jgi:hypothetical protein
LAFAGAVELAGRAVALAEQLADPGLIARALLGLEEAHAQTGHMSDRQLNELLERAELMAHEVGDWHTLTQVLSNQTVNFIDSGELEKAPRREPSRD